MNEIHPSNSESCNYCRNFVRAQRAQRAHKGLIKGSSNILPLPDRKLNHWLEKLVGPNPRYLGEVS
jgi:hypothetical protein